MKKILFLLLNIFLMQSSFAQQSLVQFMDSLESRPIAEISGKSNTYYADTIQNTMCGISNKISPYAKMASNIGNGKYSVTLESQEVMKQAAKESLAEHFSTQPVDNWANISVHMSSDMSGKIQDVLFTYDCDYNIPILAIEKLEQAIKARCRLKFDRNTPALLNANYVTFSYPLFIKESCF